MHVDGLILLTYALAGALVAAVGYWKARAIPDPATGKPEPLDTGKAGLTVAVGTGLGVAMYFGLDLNAIIGLAAAYGLTQVSNTAIGIGVKKIPDAQKFLQNLFS